MTFFPLRNTLRVQTQCVCSAIRDIFHIVLLKKKIKKYLYVINVKTLRADE